MELQIQSPLHVSVIAVDKCHYIAFRDEYGAMIGGTRSINDPCSGEIMPILSATILRNK